jgi:hypothetical protein
MQISADFINVACDWRPGGYNFPATGGWRPLGYNLYATGGHSGTIYMQTLHALAASCVQSRQFFASTLREQLLELKNEDAIKKSENLRDTCAC